MYQEILYHIKPEFEKAVEFFKKEIAKIRTGQASPSLVEDVMVEMYGQKMPIKQLAAISCPERRQILIEPWDKSSLGPMEKALSQSPLGTSPIGEKDAIRIILAPLTQEFREKLLRFLGEKTEETKEVIRKLRDEAWSKMQEEVRTGNMREGDKFKGKEELQKVVDEYNKKIQEALERKTKEIEVE
ncbi:MAG: ribosome-recycling factor [Patescibacteria group bacterium]